MLAKVVDPGVPRTFKKNLRNQPPRPPRCLGTTSRANAAAHAPVPFTYSIFLIYNIIYIVNTNKVVTRGLHVRVEYAKYKIYAAIVQVYSI